MSQARIAVIGGSGFYEMDGLTDIEQVRISTPYGDPSDAITIGTLAGERVAFLARHGKGHRFMPSEVPVRANIWALKSLGVEHIISISAVGSLRRKVKPRHFVVPDQLIDRTQGRPSSFFGNGLVAHVGMADPFCPHLSGLLIDAAEDSKAKVHEGGALVVIEGPAFSTRAESELYRSWGARIIGMTALPEAKLAREAEICYAVLACVTDYDVWHSAEEDVTVEMVIKNLQKNVKRAKQVVRAVIEDLAHDTCECDCATVLDSAIISDITLAPQDRLDTLAPIIDRYLAAFEEDEEEDDEDDDDEDEDDDDEEVEEDDEEESEDDEAEASEGGASTAEEAVAVAAALPEATTVVAGAADTAPPTPDASSSDTTASSPDVDVVTSPGEDSGAILPEEAAEAVSAAPPAKRSRGRRRTPPPAEPIADTALAGEDSGAILPDTSGEAADSQDAAPVSSTTNEEGHNG